MWPGLPSSPLHGSTPPAGGGGSSPAPGLVDPSSLIKQFYTRQPAAAGYLADIGADAENQFLNYARLTGGYTAAPAQPLPLKPNVYAAMGAAGSLEQAAAAGYPAFHPDQGLYHPPPSSFHHIHNTRGQSWYSGN